VSEGRTGTARLTRATFLRRSVGLVALVSAGMLPGSPVRDPGLARAASPRTSFPQLRTVDVRRHGARGDGRTDDSAAIRAAVAAMTPGSVLFFPPGRYRVAQRSREGAAILLSGLHDVAVEMARHAVLSMENLDADGAGGGHGIEIRGAARGIRLLNCAIEWPRRAAVRSEGDGIRLLGYPGRRPPAGWTASSGPVRDVVIRGCRVTGAPQTGAVLMGCENARIEDFRATATRADGLHVNASRAVHVRGLVTRQTGDDGLAWVTYLRRPAGWLGPQGPFARASLDAWSNSGCSARSVRIEGGRANGVRIAGCAGVSLSDIEVERVGSGVIVDAGLVGPDNGWQYLASRKTTIARLRTRACAVGLLVQVFNAGEGDDPRLHRFGLTVRDANLVGSRQYSVRVEGAGGERSIVSGVSLARIVARGPAPASFSAVRRCRLSEVAVTGGSLVICGMAAPVARLGDLPSHRLTLDRIAVTGGGILLQDLRDVSATRLSSSEAPYTGVDLTRVVHCRVGRISVTRPNRADDGLARGLLVAKCRQIVVDDLLVRTDGNGRRSWRSLEIGGGDAEDRSRAVTVRSMRYVSSMAWDRSDVVVQGGAYAPTEWSYALLYTNRRRLGRGWTPERGGDRG
jgi:hypothetical protein